MDTSNIDVVTTGDVEDQRHNPQWFVDHEYMLRPNQEDEANKLGYFILKVPEYRRQPPQEFSPQGWQFGLHNRENLNSIGSDAIKLAIAVQYGLVGEDWVHFRDAIVDDPKAMLACYGLQNDVVNWSVEQIKHVLALDALFLADYLDMGFPEHESQLWVHKTSLPSQVDLNNVFFARFGMWEVCLVSDLCLVENQIPLVLIDKVVKYINDCVSSPTYEDNEPLIGDLQSPTFKDNETPIHDLQQYQQRSLEIIVYTMTFSFMDVSHEAFKIDNSWVLDERTHILGFIYKVICGFEGLLIENSMQRIAYIHIPSATKLEQSGIKIVGVEGPLCTMSYKKKCLHLPKMKMYDETISFIRNMALYEANSISNGCLFSDYIFLMFDLIQTLEDVDLLVKCGVIDNGCGIRTFGMWTGLRKGSLTIPSSQTHNDMKAAIVSRCDQRRYGLWSEFKIVFCSKPWVVLSTIAVVLVTLATLIQTYVSIIGSNKMKPKFP